jgi:hypothetical protein
MWHMWRRCGFPGRWVWLAAFVAWTAEGESWFPFNPKPDAFTNGSAIDLRFLNERFAGEQGFIGVKAASSSDGRASRCGSAVNSPPHG